MVRFLCLALVLGSAYAENKYCGDDNCYDILGVDRSSNDAAIKKAYRNMALKYHPDKNQEEGAGLKFAHIGRAYEVLSSKLLRRAYDYYLDHPEEHLTNMYKYYEANYPIKTPPWYVLLGVLIFVSSLQYINDSRNYAQTLRYIKIQAAFKRRVNERTEELAGKKKLNKIEKAKLREQAEEDVFLEVEIDGSGPPSIWKTAILKLPIALPKAVYSQMRWFVLFSVLQQEYGEADQLYLTQKALATAALAKWAEIDEATQKALLALKLWEDSNLKTLLEGEKELEARGKKGLLTNYSRPSGKRILKEDDYYD